MIEASTAGEPAGATKERPPGASGAPVTAVHTRAYRVPLQDPETDGTFAWSSTTMVAVVVAAGGRTGLGWTYGPAAAAAVVDEVLAPAVRGLDAFDIGRIHMRMRRATRNAPTPGLVSLAIAAVDVALWDLKARLLDVPLTRLFGRVTTRVPLYGSGGFVSLTDAQLRDQLAGWVTEAGMTAVKIKIGEDRGRNLRRDLRRMALARDTVGPDVAVMVDANGGYETKQALQVAREAAEVRIAWFEEPVSSDRLADLALLRAAMEPEVAAGEYGTTIEYFRRMCEAGAVDCLQIDATRCGGYSGLFGAAAVADSFGLSVSTHCAPYLHAYAAAAVPNLRHCEWFADHVRAAGLLLDGLPVPVGGKLPVPDDVPGHGLTLRADAGRYAVN